MEKKVFRNLWILTEYMVSLGDAWTEGQRGLCQRGLYAPSASISSLWTTGNVHFPFLVNFYHVFKDRWNFTFEKYLLFNHSLSKLSVYF